MHDRLDASGILTAWETGAARRPLDRALAILWAAGSGDDPADLPLAERDRRLLALRAATFGADLPVLTTCPDCGATLEMQLDARALAETLPTDSRAGPAAGRLTRPITSRDLAAIAGLDGAARDLALRARLACTAQAPAADLDHEIEAAATAAELTTRITCTECSGEWAATLDVAAHLWADVEAAALRLLAEVADLAACFGWAEAEILALSPARRAAYLGWARA